MRRLLLFVLLTACSSAEKSSDDETLLDSSATTETSTTLDTGSAATDTAATETTPELDVGKCTPTETVESKCDGVDNDCNGAIDDVDVGKDGICDCLGILILGNTGSLAASTFEAWLKEKGTTSKRRLDSAGGPLTVAELTGIDIVILDRLSRDYSMDEINVLTTWVKGGGALIAMTGYDHSGADATRPNGIIEPLGAKYDVANKLNGPATTWNMSHPIAKDMTSVTFAGGYGVLPVTGFKTTVVASIGSTTVGVASETGMGRVFVWGDEWIEYDSEWKAIPSIPKLWANIFGWVVQRRCGVKIF
jgi:hypothetical protein